MAESRNGRTRRSAGKTVSIEELQRLAKEREADGATIDVEIPAKAPDPNAYPVPADAAFGSGDAMPSPDLEQIAREIIQTTPDLEWLRTVRIAYRWVRKGGSSGGKRTLGQTVQPGKLWRADTKSQMVVWLSADTLRLLNVTRDQVVALLDERLEAIGRDESGRIRRDAPDFAGYTKNVRRRGAHTAELRAAADAFGYAGEVGTNQRLPFDESAETPDDEQADTETADARDEQLQADQDDDEALSRTI